MKIHTLLLSAFAASAVFAAGLSSAQAMDVSFADAAWDGKSVPAGQQCQKFDGKDPATPRFKIAKIPAGTTEIVFAYSDRDYQPMDNGGHGIVAYALSGDVTEIEVPAAPGHSFDLKAPFRMVKAHQGPGWDKAGAYMPPCSGGKGNNYYVTVKAVSGSGDVQKVLAEKVVEMGKF